MLQALLSFIGDALPSDAPAKRERERVYIYIYREREIYIYIYIHTYIYVYIHLYTCIYVCICFGVEGRGREVLPRRVEDLGLQGKQNFAFRLEERS